MFVLPQTDTQGRTPGAYGFIISCDFAGYVGRDDVIHGATIALHRGKGQGINPLSSAWSYPGGTGPAKLNIDMVRSGASHPSLMRRS